MRVYIVRHGLEASVWPGNWKLVPVALFDALLRRKRGTRLVPVGRAEARHAAGQLARMERDRDGSIAHLYSSPYPRALATARILGRRLRLSPDVVGDLREISPRPLPPNGRRELVLWLKILSRLATLWPWGRGESWYAGFARLRRVWRALTRSAECDIVVVTHHWFIRTLLVYLWLNPRWRVRRHDMRHAGISVVERDSWRSAYRRSRGYGSPRALTRPNGGRTSSAVRAP